MKKITVKDWFLFGEWYDIFWFHSAYVDGLAFTIKERLGYGISQMIVEQEKNVQRIMFSRSEWTEIGKRWLAEVIQEPNKLASVSADLRKAADELNLLSSELKKLEVGTLSEEEIVGWFKKYQEKHFTVWTLGQITNVLELENSLLSDYLKNILKEKGLIGEELIKVFQVLSTPRELSAAQKEEREMLKIVSENNNQTENTKHWQKFSWITFGWTGPNLSLEYFTEVAKGLLKEGRAEKLAEVLEKDQQLLVDKEFWINKLNFSEPEIILFRQMEELLFMKTYRMDALFSSYEAIQPILKRIAKDNYFSLAQIYNITMPLLIEMLEKGCFEHDFINELGNYSVRYFDGEKIYLLTGEAAVKCVEPAKKVLPKLEQVNELKGECGYPGKVIGKVSIVNRAEEMNKFSEGDILVSIVTDPSLLPIMKKASAFVTNQGGLTCHAAIVARELHIPCIIGTKSATYVLKDGDTVEVDATSGTVIKLSC